MGFIFSKPTNQEDEGWSYCTEKFEEILKPGDLIEFDRVFYSHWGIYVGHGLVAHFNPIESPENGAVNEMGHFVPGAVTKASIRTVANIGRMRVNNKLEIKSKRRPLEEILKIIKKLVNKPGLYYSLGYFNCEHFVTWLKFKNMCNSSQVTSLDKHVFRTLKIFQIPHYETESIKIFNTLAYLQWQENLRVLSNEKYSGKIQPHQIFQEGIREWEVCCDAVRNPGWVRWFLSHFGIKLSMRKAVKNWMGFGNPVLFSEDFKKFYDKT